jgi:serine/threonine protein kinase
MEDSTSSSESLVLNSRKTRKLYRPDLDDEDFQELDLKKVDEYRKVFVGGRLLSGQENEPITPNMVEEDGVPFARGSMSYVFGGTIRGQWFAIKRSWISIDDDRESYNKEIKSLQTLRESGSWHVVQLIGHYTNPANEGRLVLSPLAECTLENYISQIPTPGRKLIVMRWFDCLAGALKNIHQQNIKHKDIKTENILVHGDNIISTDFGISNKFTERSTSLGDSPGSLMYMAPEVLNKGRRGRQQDVWSLMCCFIEMLSFITDFTVSDFRKWCNPSEWSFNFNNDYDRVIAWLNYLGTQTEVETHIALIDLLLSGLKKEPRERPTADYLFDRLRDMGTFVGECCALPRCRYEPGSKKFSLSLSTDPQLLERGSLSHFIVSAGRRIIDRLDITSVRASITELLEEIELEQVQSFRSAERKVMFYIAPVRSFRVSKETVIVKTSLTNSFL